MTFQMTDFDAMRTWLFSIKGSPAIKKARVKLFETYRYREDYEAIYNFIIEMGGQIV